MYHFELKPSRQGHLWSTQSQWEKQLENFFDGLSHSGRYTPACEIADEEDSFHISLDIPGLKPEEIEIEVKENHLHVNGVRKEASADKSKVLRSERKYGKFARVFTLPINVNTDNIKAHFENGVLDIHLPKEEKFTSKKITIQKS